MTNVFKSHSEFQAELAEFALGVLNGRPAAQLSLHVATCSECTQDLEELTTTVDALLRVPDAVSPPIGFESRVMDQIHLEAAHVARVRSPAKLLVAAAALVVFSFGIGWATHSLTSTSSTPVGLAIGHTEHRQLTAGGRSVGLVYAYTGRPSWMFVSVDAPGAPTLVRCVAVTTTGQRRILGTFGLSNGKGVWGTRLPVPIQGIQDIQLTSTSGVVEARLATTSWSTAPARPN